MPSVPVISDPLPPSPGQPQITLTEMHQQLITLTEQAITDTGLPDGWYWGFRGDGTAKPWDPAKLPGGAAPCRTVGTKGSGQDYTSINHDPTGEDPVVMVQRMTAAWEAQGFTVATVVSIPSTQDYEIRADRADGVGYAVTSTKQIIALDISTQCSNDASVTNALGTTSDNR